MVVYIFKWRLADLLRAGALENKSQAVATRRLMYSGYTTCHKKKKPRTQFIPWMFCDKFVDHVSCEHNLEAVPRSPMTKNKELHNSAFICNQVLDLYKNLLNSYIADFYLENHWNNKVSNNWKYFLEDISVGQIGDLLSYEKQLNYVAPLTLLCLRDILRTFSVRRTQVNMIGEGINDMNFKKCLWKGVKLKKRHEIEIMSKTCHQMAIRTNCIHIVDIGSGLGHLSRLLSFQYGFNICTFEANSALASSAFQLDSQFEKMLLLKNIPHKAKQKPIHINRKIEETLCYEEFESIIRKAFKNYDPNFKFGIIGLHPCGNLGPTLLHLYNHCSSAAFISVVSCCYMKLSLEPSAFCGFPLSSFYKKYNCRLDYLSCEAACHAIENYIDKIGKREHNHLKIHAFRAALESLLVKANKDFRHCAVGSVKYEEGLTFKEYCEKATKKYDLIFCNKDLDLYEKLIEETWINVVKFYSVKLLLAPVVESVILYDRLLYLLENKSVCDIVPVFNSEISPRNQVLLAQKIN